MAMKAFVYWNGKDYTVINFKTKKKITNIDDVILINCDKYTWKDKKGYVGILSDEVNPKLIRELEYSYDIQMRWKQYGLIHFKPNNIKYVQLAGGYYTKTETFWITLPWKMYGDYCI
jgi:hypothetical protein